MITRAMYTFVDSTKDGGGKYHVYKHHDGYPEDAVQHISGLLRFAWKLPRFEADEAAASFVAANKNEGGGVRLMHSGVWSEVAPGDQQGRAPEPMAHGYTQAPALLWLEGVNQRIDHHGGRRRIIRQANDDTTGVRRQGRPAASPGCRTAFPDRPHVV